MKRVREWKPPSEEELKKSEMCDQRWRQDNMMRDSMVNLRRILLELEDRLVMEHGFSRASINPFVEFTELLDATPEAREVLESMGVEWTPSSLTKR